MAPADAFGARDVRRGTRCPDDRGLLVDWVTQELPRRRLAPRRVDLGHVRGRESGGGTLAVT